LSTSYKSSTAYPLTTHGCGVQERMYLGEWELEDHGGYDDNDPMIVTLLDFGHQKGLLALADKSCVEC